MTRDPAAEALLRERMDALCDAVDEDRSCVWNVVVGDRECARALRLDVPDDTPWFAFVAQKDGRRMDGIVGEVVGATSPREAVRSYLFVVAKRAASASEGAADEARERQRDADALADGARALLKALLDLS